MQHRKKVVIFCFLLVSGIGGCPFFARAEEISYDRYVAYHDLFSQKILAPVESLSQRFLGMKRCVAYDRDDSLIVTPECLRQDATDLLSFAESVRMILPTITHINGFYETEQDTFTYQTAQLTIDPTLLEQTTALLSPQEGLLHLLSKKGTLIRIPKTLLALSQLSKRSVYAAVRDTRSYGACRKQNYDIALEQVNGAVLKPGERFNMNQHIANLPNYCGGQAYMFSEGVCGGSTQLFWNALVNPYLYITKRFNHNQRFAGFYGSNVLGDDASMYEMSKQFEIQNISDVPIAFATFALADGNTALLSFVPKSEPLVTTIEKVQQGPLNATVTKSVTDLRTESLAYQQKRDSRYASINDEIDTPYRTITTQ